MTLYRPKSSDLILGYQRVTLKVLVFGNWMNLALPEHQGLPCSFRPAAGGRWRPPGHQGTRSGTDLVVPATGTRLPMARSTGPGRSSGQILPSLDLLFHSLSVLLLPMSCQRLGLPSSDELQPSWIRPRFQNNNCS